MPASPEPTRTIRQRLVRAAGEGAPVLRIASAGSLCHPEAPALLAETRLLRFVRVEVAAEGSRLDELDGPELRAFAGLHRVDVALYGPGPEEHDAHTRREGSWMAALQGLRRLHDAVGVAAGAHAVLHDARDVRRFAEAWDAGVLPGRPAFRLSARGGCLDTLARAVAALPRGDAQTALALLLPPCLLPHRPVGEAPASPGMAFDGGQLPERGPSGSDRLGWFTPCTCDCDLRAPCPGLAQGWLFNADPRAAAASSGRRRS